MKIQFSQLDRGYLKYKKEYDQAAIDTLESGWYIMGERLEKFEREFAKFAGTTHCIGLNSGMDALTLSVRALGIGPGDEVIVPGNTYIASALAISENGATPVFVDPDEFYNLDAYKIEEKITERTKAIMAVHLYGQAANMADIKALADQYEFYLIEDTAQSHGARIEGVMSGAWGDVGCYSFYPTKNMGAFGDAGAVVTNNEDLATQLRMLRNYGSLVKYQHEIIGVNSRLDEIQAALLSVKLSHYEEFRKEREAIAKRYLSKIHNPLIVLPKIREQVEHVWHLFVIRTLDRDKLQVYLERQGIGTQTHYPIPPHLTKAYRSLGYEKGDLPLTEKYAETILSLPLYEGMTMEEVDYVIEKVNEYGG